MFENIQSSDDTVQRCRSYQNSPRPRNWKHDSDVFFVPFQFEEFSKRHKYMMNFIHTAAKPPIMWLPKTHTKDTEKLLARSKAKIQIIIEKEEERMLLEVERIEGITRASDGEPDEKENSHLPSSVAVVVKHG